jgi:hypothetical protein
LSATATTTLSAVCAIENSMPAFGAATRVVRGTRPGTAVSMYVGGWYGSIHQVGQSWAA